jgi:hypothetical protein
MESTDGRDDTTSGRFLALDDHRNLTPTPIFSLRARVLLNLVGPSAISIL